ncbi:MAG: hypothetical protein NT144_06575 [Bacteroidia bacterium]|nr:hypothetical protein [Bacteroidia bacterium]
MGVQEMNALEMNETDGGCILLLCCLCVLLLASCVNGPVTVQVGGSHNSSSPTGGGTMSADSTLNGNSFEAPLN